jgi:hypothetical protein
MVLMNWSKLHFVAAGIVGCWLLIVGCRLLHFYFMKETALTQISNLNVSYYKNYFQISKLRFETSKLDILCERCRWP